MNHHSFTKILDNPSKLKEIDFDALLQLSKQYPFVSIFHTLLAKKAHVEKPYEYDNFLSKAAIHALDRKKLYYIIHEKINKEKETEHVTEVIETFIAKEIDVPTEFPIIEKELDTNTINTEVNIISNEHQNIPFINGSFTDVPAYIEEVESEKEIKIKKDKKQKPKKEDKKKKIKKNISVISVNINDRNTFTTWLRQIDKQRKGNNEEELNTSDNEVENLEDEYYAGDFEAKLHQEIIAEAKVANTNTIPQLPQNWRSNNEKYEINISDLAEKSVQKNEHIITETFAKILELQKKYDAAIDAYQTLSLKYPEKSSFFANRISEIKNKM